MPGTAEPLYAVPFPSFDSRHPSVNYLLERAPDRSYSERKLQIKSKKTHEQRLLRYGTSLALPGLLLPGTAEPLYAVPFPSFDSRHPSVSYLLERALDRSYSKRKLQIKSKKTDEQRLLRYGTSLKLPALLLPGTAEPLYAVPFPSFDSRRPSVNYLLVSALDRSYSERKIQIKSDEQHPLRYGTSLAFPGLLSNF